MKKIWINSSTEVVMRAVVFLTLCAMAVSGKMKCKPDEVKMCANKDWQECFCRKCLSCPPGYGPNRPCGGRYVNGSTIIKCIPCISLKNYSHEYSIASCQPCVQCEGKKTLQECTAKSKRICSTICQEGYSMNYATDECLPDPSFKTPPGQSSTTAKWTTTHLPKTTTTQQPSSTTPIQLTKTQTKPHGTTKSSTHPDISGSNLESNSANNSESNSASNSASNLVSNSASGDSSHSRDNKIIILSVSGITLVVGVVCFLKKRQMFCFRHATGNQNSEEIPLSDYKDSISPRSSQEIVPWPDKFRLKDIVLALRSDIANHIGEGLTIGLINGWRAIGEKVKLSPNELKAISAAGHLKTHTNEGEQLLLKLETCQPELTLTEFVNILENLGRKDVVNLIKDHYNNENKANINANQISVTPQNSHPEPEFV